jgi:hypothetical protein
MATVKQQIIDAFTWFKGKIFTTSLSTSITNAAPTSATVAAAMDDKVDKVSGKGLSTEDYTTAEKTKLSGIVKALWVNMGTISSLPVTKSASGVQSDMVCAKAELGTPSAQTSDWTVTTSSGSVTVSGSISGSTTLKMLLVQETDVTAS